MKLCTEDGILLYFLLVVNGKLFEVAFEGVEVKFHLAGVLGGYNRASLSQSFFDLFGVADGLSAETTAGWHDAGRGRGANDRKLEFSVKK